METWCFEAAYAGGYHKEQDEVFFMSFLVAVMLHARLWAARCGIRDANCRAQHEEVSSVSVLADMHACGSEADDSVDGWCGWIVSAMGWPCSCFLT